jgi:putative acetyltransferase
VGLAGRPRFVYGDLDMELRAHTDTDLLEIGTLYRDAVHELATEHCDAAQRLAWAPLEVDVDRWRTRLEGREVLVAERDGKIVGFVAWTRKGHVDLLYTHPSAARRGIASRLVDTVEADLLDRGIERATVSASDVSRPLFAARGYEVVGEDIHEVRGAVLRSTRMEKSLRG